MVVCLRWRREHCSEYLGFASGIFHTVHYMRVCAVRGFSGKDEIVLVTSEV